MLQTGQKLPAIDSIQNNPKPNADGLTDIYFSAEAQRIWGKLGSNHLRQKLFCYSADVWIAQTMAWPNLAPRRRNAGRIDK